MDERYLPAPPMDLSDDKVRDFERLWQGALAQGGEIAYNSPHPKYEFLCWLGETQDVVLHGSNEMDIAEFKPSRRGFDANPHGNHRAIYATNDGIWPMFFAVLDKSNYRGSMRNGVMWVMDDGRELDFDPAAAGQGGRKVYLFSLNADELPKRPWREAMIYILPRVTFKQLRDRDGIRIAEWASREPVTPIAKLRVAPQDFPFVDRVVGHDDTQVARNQELMKALVTEATAIEERADGYAFSYAWSDQRRAEALEFGEGLRGFMAAASVDVMGDAATGLRVQVCGPEALKDAIAHRIDQYRNAVKG
jgi:hypothetical protein